MVVTGQADEEITAVKVFPLIVHSILLDSYVPTWEHCDLDIVVVYRGISTKLRGFVALFALYRPAEFQPSPI